jgi:hypothetical protein
MELLVVVILLLYRRVRVETLPGTKEGLALYAQVNSGRVEDAIRAWREGTISSAEKRWLLRFAGMAHRVGLWKSREDKNEGEVV